MIIAVGFKVNSERAVQFRKWVNQIAKDYMSFVPLGYFIMFAWLAIMITAMILLRKNKANFLSFILPWFMGLVACLVAVFVIL